MLCAHLHTVPLAGLVEVTRENGVLTNRHEAILAADNKTAVATAGRVRGARGGAGRGGRRREAGGRDRTGAAMAARERERRPPSDDRQ
jgi:hypothetical protein